VTRAPVRRVGVADLLRRPGSRRELHEDLRLGELAVVATRVAEDEDVVVDLVLESLSNGIVATCTVEVPWVGECRRCLEPVRGRTRQRVQEVFGGEEGDEDAYPLKGDEIDLDPMLRDVVTGALPLVPLCDEGCQGPSPESFPTGPAEEAGEAHGDPRWAALDELRFE
jgi:DUF177 domain-containing protein